MYRLDTPCWTLTCRPLSKRSNGILILFPYLRHQIPPELLNTIPNFLVLSHVRCCLLAFGNEWHKCMQRLWKITMFALRTVSGQRELEHVRGRTVLVCRPAATRSSFTNFVYEIRCTRTAYSTSSQLQVKSPVCSRITRHNADQPIPLLSSPNVIPHPPMPYAIRVWWTSFTRKVADLVSPPGIGRPPVAVGLRTRPRDLVVPWSDLYGRTWATSISPRTNVNPLSYIP